MIRLTATARTGRDREVAPTRISRYAVGAVPIAPIVKGIGNINLQKRPVYPIPARVVVDPYRQGNPIF